MTQKQTKQKLPAAGATPPSTNPPDHPAHNTQVDIEDAQLDSVTDEHAFEDPRHPADPRPAVRRKDHPRR